MASSSSGTPKNLDWTTPKTEHQIYEEIAKAAFNVTPFAEWEKYQRFQVKRAQKAYPNLKLSWEKAVKYHTDKYDEEREAEVKPLISVKEFFKRASNWDPFSPDRSNSLVSLLTSDFLDDLPLGKLNGTHMYYLIPGTGALPPNGIPDDATDFGFARAGGGAIAYLDGHPSEADQTITFRPRDDDKLRHVMPLGWLARVTDEKRQTWERTGHTLVMDMDEGRQRHPWIVLANYWPDKREEYENEFVYAEVEVEAGDPDVYGILPGTIQRTPIGKIVFGRGDQNRDETVLRSFGPEFTFEVQRYGGVRAGTSTKRKGPPLAEVMDWYDDTEKGQFVCYDSDGAEYMRYDKEKKAYLYPSRFSKAPKSPQSRFIPLEERFGGLSVEGSSSTAGPSRSRAEAGTSTDY